MLALGAQHSSSAERRSEFEAGAELTRTCHEMYYQQPSGISPEFVNFAPNRDFYVPQRAPHYLLRPGLLFICPLEIPFTIAQRLLRAFSIFGGSLMITDIESGAGKPSSPSIIHVHFAEAKLVILTTSGRVASGFSGIRDVRDTGDKVRYDDTQQVL